MYHFAVKFIKSASWQDKLVEFVEKFFQHQRDIGLCLSVAIHHTTVRIENAINQINDILRQRSKTEIDVHQFMEAQGGIENCLADDKLFIQLVKKSGVTIAPKEAQSTHRLPTPYHQLQGYASAANILPFSSQFVYATRHRYPRESERFYEPPVLVLERRSRSRSPRRHDSPPTVIAQHTRPSRRITYIPSPSPPRHSRHHYRRHAADRSRSRSPSPTIYRRGRRYSPRRSASQNSHSSQDDVENSDAIAQFKIQVKSALEATLDVVIQQNTTLWMIKFNHQTQAIQLSIEASKNQILKAMELGQSGQHERLHDSQMRKIWELEVNFSVILCRLAHPLW